MTPAPWTKAPTGAPAALAARVAAAVPELRTARLRLRAPRIGDAAIFARFVEDAPGAASIPGAERRREAWLDFCQLVAGWMLRGYGAWTFEAAGGDGPPLGGVLVNHEFGDPEPEIGWVVARDAEGRGHVTEAARAVLDHAFGPMGFTTLVSYVDADNSRSAAVAERLGAARDARAEAAIGHACHVYRHHPGGARP